MTRVENGDLNRLSVDTNVKDGPDAAGGSGDDGHDAQHPDEATDTAGPLLDKVPEVRITESTSPTASPRASTQTDPLPHGHASSSRASLSAASAAASTVRSRRATMDGRSNRLSGFFSQLLTTRRPDREPPMPNERPPSPPVSPSVARPTTPPPALAPPSLAELGLSLSVITSGLTAAQYATPPTSGTFLAPHYLLLCHAQGLDVLPLHAPPAPQPYALVRRVAFKSVIVMEERGVLVAIAGRRDGVRVYALEEVRRAVEWRLDLELKREAEAARRSRDKGKAKPPTPIPGVTVPASNSAPSALAQQPTAPPPSYSASVGEHNFRPLITRVSTTNLAAVANAHRNRGASLSSIVGLGQGSGQKSEWGEVPPSDDEALVAAGPEASAALDERTSAAAQHQPPAPVAAVASPPLQIGGAARRATVGAEAAPGATLSTMRSALAHSRSNSFLPRSPTLQRDADGAEPGGDSVSFAEMLRESRMPPPPVTPSPTQRRASVVMLQSASHPVYQPGELDPVGEDTDHPQEEADAQRSRRWSFVAPSSTSLPEPIISRPPNTNFTNTNTESLQDRRAATVPTLAPIPLPPTPPAMPPPSPRQGSHRSTRSHPLPTMRPPSPPSAPPQRRRLFPKILSAFSGKKNRSRSRDRAASAGAGASSSSLPNAGAEGGEVGVAAAPKLEYIKLPGTKGAIMIKAVETPKKSFLAILCGESGEKVELFAGTYRTALGLSRTFILPDSPKSLELQLQGDDLVEVFLVFAQNVFGLEPATVRVREVRIGRNERRAARRRARAAGGGGSGGAAPLTGGETVVTTTVTVGDDAPTGGSNSRRSGSIGRRRREVQGRVVTSPDVPEVPPVPSTNSGTSTPQPHALIAGSQMAPSSTPDPMADELAALSTAQAGPYTTFQQLSFAPRFPLASIADDYVIPPTYLEFLDYRETYEHDLPRVEAAPRQPETDTNTNTNANEGGEAEGRGKDKAREEDELEDDPAHALQFEQPEPVVSVPSVSQPTVVKWFYLDPKGVVQGPWKPSIMQNWLREGYLPPELPVRRADETEYTLLKDLRASVEDPSEPFKARPVVAPAPPPAPAPAPAPAPEEKEQVPEGSGAESEPAPTPEPVAEDTASNSVAGPSSAPPTPGPVPTEPVAPFAPTKALLKPISLLAQPRHFGPPALFYCSRGGHSTTVVDARGRPVLKGRIHWSAHESMGDTQRVEAFDVGDRAVFVALRQGGIEATDIGEALLEPGDESRTALPSYRVHTGAASRRSPWVWRLGTSTNSTNGHVGHGKRRAGGRRRVPTSGAGGASNGRTALDGVPGDSGDESDGGYTNTPEESVTFLARESDNVYICERSAGKFRLLRLSKAGPSTAA